MTNELRCANCGATPAEWDGFFEAFLCLPCADSLEIQAQHNAHMAAEKAAAWEVQPAERGI